MEFLYLPKWKLHGKTVAMKLSAATLERSRDYYKVGSFCIIKLLPHHSENQRCIRSAKPEAVRQDSLDLLLLRLQRHKVETGTHVGVLQVQSRRYKSLVMRLD